MKGNIEKSIGIFGYIDMRALSFAAWLRREGLFIFVLGIDCSVCGDIPVRASVSRSF